jgi:hypothetical protein
LQANGIHTKEELNKSMVDWLSHVLLAWIICQILSVKFKFFGGRNTAIVMIGALIPDIIKVGLLFRWINIDIWDFIVPLHTPVGAVLSAAVIALFFEEHMNAFKLLLFGMATHFLFDLPLAHLSGGMLMLFPFHWGRYQVYIIPTDDCIVPILASVVAIVIYIVKSRVTAKNSADS